MSLQAFNCVPNLRVEPFRKVSGCYSHLRNKKIHASKSSIIQKRPRIFNGEIETEVYIHEEIT